MTDTHAQNTKDPRNISPSSAYPEQQKEKMKRDDADKTLLRVCDFSTSQLCNAKLSRYSGKCNSNMERCKRNVQDNIDASCTKQKCEIEKAACLVGVAQQYELCLRAAAPIE